MKDKIDGVREREEEIETDKKQFFDELLNATFLSSIFKSNSNNTG